MGLWSERQRQFQFFLATPVELRTKDCKTEEQFAKRFDLKPETLAMWKLLPGWWDEVYSVALSIIGAALPDILETLVVRARSGHVTAIKLALQALGVFTEKSENKQVFDNDQLTLILDKSDASTDELQAALARKKTIAGEEE